MPLFIHVATILILIIVAYQDFNERKIHWILIPACFFLLYWNAIKSVGLIEAFKFTFQNFLFFSLQIILVSTYFFLKYKKSLNIINTFLGIGDVLFLLAICPGFAPVNFIIFYLITLILGLTGFLIYRKVIAVTSSEIPLAGIIAISMGSLFLYKDLGRGFDIYDNEFLVNLAVKWNLLSSYH